MRVVLDSNVICRDFQLAGSMFRVFLDGLGTIGYSLHVPRVVVDEVTNKYAEELEKCKTKIQEQISKIHKLTRQTLASPIDEEKTKRMVTGYRKRLKTSLSQVGATILKYPRVSHRTVVRRALARIRPFSVNDKGYRDFLIWIAIIKLAKEGSEPVALITADRGFADENGGLHKDLVADLLRNSLGLGSVILSRSLEEFVDGYIKPKMKTEEYLRVRLSAGVYRKISLETILLEQTVDLIGTVELDPSDIGFPEEFESPTISGVEEVSEIEVKRVSRLQSGELFVEVEADAYCESDFFIFKSNLYVLEDKEAPSISDYDWNEAYMAASKSKEVHIALYVTALPDSGRVTSMDLLSISEKHATL